MQCNVSRTVVEHAYRDRVNWLTVVLRDRALTPPPGICPRPENCHRGYLLPPDSVRVMAGYRVRVKVARVMVRFLGPELMTGFRIRVGLVLSS